MTYHWLWATIPLGLVCLVVLALMIWRLVATHRSVMVAAVPLVGEQELELQASGPMLLHGEGPRFTRAFGGLDYCLTDLDEGREVPLSGVLFKSSSSGLRTARLSLRAFAVERPGRYRLTVLGLEDDTPMERHRIIITHDRRGRMVAFILALVFSAIGFVVSLVLSLLVFAFNR